VRGCVVLARRPGLLHTSLGPRKSSARLHTVGALEPVRGEMQKNISRSRPRDRAATWFSKLVDPSSAQDLHNVNAVFSAAGGLDCIPSKSRPMAPINWGATRTVGRRCPQTDFRIRVKNDQWNSDQSERYQKVTGSDPQISQYVLQNYVVTDVELFLL